MSVAVVIVNYKTPELVKACLSSIAEEPDAATLYKVYVGDADSGDGSTETINAFIEEQGFGFASCFDIGGNYGFAYGNNYIVKTRVLQDPDVEFVHFLNPDTYIRKGAITALVEGLKAHPKAAIAGSRLENPDGSLRAYAFRFPSPMREFFRGARVPHLDRVWPGVELKIPDVLETRKVDWVSGASFMMPRAALDRVGLMDDGYFLYFEEVDLMARARDAGYEIWHVADSQIVHLAGQATGMRAENALEAGSALLVQFQIPVLQGPLWPDRRRFRQLPLSLRGSDLPLPFAAALPCAAGPALPLAGYDQTWFCCRKGEGRHAMNDQRGGQDHCPFEELTTVGVVAANSVAYVREMLGNLGSGTVSVPLSTVGDSERLRRTFTSDVIEPEAGGGWVEMPFRSEAGDRPAQISFTSGTQGVPKAVLLSCGNLNDVVERVTAAMEITPEIREYVGVPVYHSFGYGRCRVALNAGGTCYIPPGGFDLAEIRRMILADEINAISAVPSLWRIFLSGLDRFGDELERIRWVEIGSQYMSANEKAALRSALPNAKIVQHYGLTEASRTTLQRIHSEPAETLESVGTAEGNVDVRIGEAGRIEIRGPHVALGIQDGDRWTPMGGDAWLQTSDVGRIEDGRLYYEGRGDDVINIGGVKVSPDLVEAAVLHDLENDGDVPEFALLRRPDPLRGDRIGLVLTPGVQAHRGRLMDQVVSQLQGLGINASGAITEYEVADLPRTSTGKLQRRELGRMLDSRGGGETAGAAPDPAAPPEGFEQLLAQLIGQQPDHDKSFTDMGGDSLLHMQINLALERALGTPPQDWEWRPFGELIGLVDKAGDFEALMAREGGAPPLPDGSTNMNPPDISFLSLVAEDYRTNDASVFHQGFLMLLVHRFGNLRMSVGWKVLRAPLTLLYRFLNKLTQLFFGMKLDYTVKVGRRVKLEHFGGMILGAREIGNDVILRQNTTIGIRSTDDLRAKPVIGDFVDVGAGAVIVGNITIGENAIIGANSVVFTSVPVSAVVMGVPAKVIGTNPRRNPSPLKGYGAVCDDAE